MPSLDLVIYKMGGNNGQYDPTLTDVPQPEPSHDCDDWKPIQSTPRFSAPFTLISATETRQAAG